MYGISSPSSDGNCLQISVFNIKKYFGMNYVEKLESLINKSLKSESKKKWKFFYRRNGCWVCADLKGQSLQGLVKTPLSLKGLVFTII